MICGVFRWFRRLPGRRCLAGSAAGVGVVLSVVLQVWRRLPDRSAAGVVLQVWRRLFGLLQISAAVVRGAGGSVRRLPSRGRSVCCRIGGRCWFRSLYCTRSDLRRSPGLGCARCWLSGFGFRAACAAMVAVLLACCELRRPPGLAGSVSDARAGPGAARGKPPFLPLLYPTYACSSAL